MYVRTYYLIIHELTRLIWWPCSYVEEILMLKNKECVCAKRTSSQANRSETILLNAVVSSELRGDNINNLKCFQTSSYTRAVDSKIYIYIYICVCVVQDEDVMYNIVHVTCGYIYIYIYTSISYWHFKTRSVHGKYRAQSRRVESFIQIIYNRGIHEGVWIVAATVMEFRREFAIKNDYNYIGRRRRSRWQQSAC